MLENKKIAFLGGGNMAEALIKGLLASGAANPEQIFAADVSQSRLEYLKKTYGIAAKTVPDAARECGVIILSVKPQVIEGVLKEIAPAIDGKKLVITIVAGITLARVEKAFKSSAHVVRVMPNTPALVLAGAAAIAGGAHAAEDDLTLTRYIFNAVGRSFLVEEKMMDAVTGISGCGPAYMFVILDALSDAGVKAGLPRQLALELAAQTMYGAAKMVMDTKEHPGKLRDMVTSPGGTTIEGLHVLEQGKLRATLMNAVEAATERSKELGKQ